MINTAPVETDRFADLREQLTQAASEFGGTSDGLAEILGGLVDDVDHALAEPLEIFPVCHHSPASGLAMVRRLAVKRPKIIYLELCEDLRPLLEELRHCRLPVAVQAFASELDGFPAEWAPLSVLAPITESSAEYQAIAYALEDPEVELVLVDRSCDHVIQWAPRESEDESGEADGTDGATPEESSSEPTEGVDLHGESVGVEIGDLRPRFAELEQYLLHHGKVRHWSEWWDQYVELPLAGADYGTYRQVMILIGSLFRRLTPPGTKRLTVDEDRERYMWTRIRQHQATSGIDPTDCLYVCGAFHAASRLPGLGTGPDAVDTPISDRTATRWHYGVIPSSHSAIEAQFGLAQGSITVAAATWRKALGQTRLTPYTLGGKPKTRSARKGAAPGPTEDGTDQLAGFLAAPPPLDDLDTDELLGWSVDLVRLARRNGYLGSTEDAIAIVDTAVLLAGLRNRSRPTPYDFADAAVTCLEKEVVPGRRDVRRLCEIMLGGDRVGQVGYASLPPLARDVYDRLSPLGLDLERRTVQRALLDLPARPELEPVSDLLWLLRYLLPSDAVRPIMGTRRLGERSVQESWDVAIGRHQRQLIELGYEGLTIEQVTEQRLRHRVWAPEATAADALAAVEDSIVFLGLRRFTAELGRRAVELLTSERSADDAPAVLARIRRLVGHFTTTAGTLPGWCRDFITTGYAHYCTLLPTGFVTDEVPLRQVAAMLGFLFSLESLALSYGCDRRQLELAVAQSHPQAPAKVALLWAAQHQLGELPLVELRGRATELLDNPLVVPSFPHYLSGFVQALDPVPRLASFLVELLSEAFARLPDRVLLPWLPTLITTLQREASELMPVLVREAGRTFPGTVAAVDTFVAPWHRSAPEAVPTAAGPAGGPARGPGAALLAIRPDTTDALAALLGLSGSWLASPAAESRSIDRPAARLLQQYGDTAADLANLLSVP